VQYGTLSLVRIVLTDMYTPVVTIVGPSGAVKLFNTTFVRVDPPPGAAGVDERSRVADPLGTNKVWCMCCLGPLLVTRSVPSDVDRRRGFGAEVACPDACCAQVFGDAQAANAVLAGVKPLAEAPPGLFAMNADPAFLQLQQARFWFCPSCARLRAHAPLPRRRPLSAQRRGAPFCAPLLARR
jgi:hypothetical protein